MRWRALFAALALVAAPARAEAPHEQWGEPISIGRSFAEPSAAFGVERRINVWLPPSYGLSDARFPVIYLIDGGLAQDFHHISGLAQLGAISWLTQEMIVVGVETVDRRRELTFPVERELALREEFPTAGESGLFRRYLVDEVKPFVSTNYRVSGEDALLGESLAGLFVVETYLRRPGAFDTYIAMDPSLWWDDGRLSDEAPTLLAGHERVRKRLWLSVGSETLGQPRFVDPLVAALKAQPANRLEFHYEPRPALRHMTIYHPTAWEALQVLYPRPEE